MFKSIIEGLSLPIRVTHSHAPSCRSSTAPSSSPLFIFSINAFCSACLFSRGAKFFSMEHSDVSVERRGERSDDSIGIEMQSEWTNRLSAVNNFWKRECDSSEVYYYFLSKSTKIV